MTGERTFTFTAVIYRQGILRVVDVPDQVAAEFAGWANPPVIVTVGERSRSTMLVPRGRDGFRLFLHDELRRPAGVDTDDRVELEIGLDPNPDWHMPEDIVEVAAKIDRGLEVLELLPSGLRREIIRFVEAAKTPETRTGYLVRVAELVRERVAKLPPADG